MNKGIMGLKKVLNDFSENYPLLKANIFYFFYDASSKTLPRYLGLYYKHTLLLSPHQIAILLSARTFTILFASPILGTLADKLNRFRNILVISLLAFLFTYVAVPFIEPAEGFHCQKHLGNTSSSILSINNTIAERKNGRYRVPIHKYSSELVKDRFGVHYHGNLMYDMFYTWPLDIWEYATTDNITANLFVILLAVTVIGEFFAAPSETFVDFYTMQTLGRNGHRYGLVIIPGLFGWGIITLAFSFITNVNVDLKDDFCHIGRMVNYSPYLFVFYGLVSACLVVALFLKFHRYDYDDGDDSNFFKCNLIDAIPVFCNVPSYLGFLVVVIFLGFGTGVKQLFIYHYMTDLGGDITSAPIIVAVHFVSNLIALLLSPKLLTKYGTIKIFNLGLFVHAITFVIYSLIQDSTLIFLVEPLNGITESLCWVAIVAYVGSPSKIGASLQGIIHGLYRGFGMSFGYLVVSVMILKFGYVLFFLFMGILYFFVMGFYICIVHLYPKNESISEQYNQYHLLFVNENNNIETDGSDSEHASISKFGGCL